MFKRMLVLCAAFMFLFPSTAKASDWELKEDGYYYTGNRQNSDSEGWIKDYGYWYYVSSKGKMYVGKKGNFFLNDGTYSDLPYGALIEENQVRSATAELDNIEFIEVSQDDKEPDRVVVLLYDLMESKDKYKNEGCQLASGGSLVLIPDVYAHSESSGSADVVTIMQETTKEIDRLLAHYVIDENTPVILMGYGFGGLIAGDYVVSGVYPVEKLVLLNSQLDLSTLAHKRYFQEYDNGYISGKTDIDSLKKRMEENTAFVDLNAFKDMKIFMVNNKKDEYIDYDEVVKEQLQLRNIADLVNYSVDTEGHHVQRNAFIEAYIFVGK